jgi:hypothetical protein
LLPRSVIALLALLISFAPIRAQAQTPSPDAAPDARIHVGGLALDPRLAVRNVGVDTNVFNDAEGEVQDFTAMVGPVLDAWLRAARLHLTSSSSVTWNYYQKSTTERSFDAAQFGRADLDLGQVTPHVSGSIERSRQRPNLEIDARVLQRTTRVGGGLVTHLGAKLAIDLAAEARDIQFDDVTFDGVNLSETLDRRETGAGVTAAYTLTPLTNLIVRASARQDRFDDSTIRDTDMVSVVPGLQFKPLALISGSAFVGFRSFKPRSSEVPAFQGAIADVDLRYVLRDLTRFTMAVVRDVDYSYEPTEPYYVSTGLTATVTQSLGSAWDVVVRGSLTRLDYRALMNEPVAPRRDHVDAYGVGVGRRLGSDIRLGFDVNRVARQSTLEERSYAGVRAGGSVTYGF